MKTLSSLDAAFLYLETPEMPMYVGALHVFELPAGYKGRFVRDLRKHIAARLPIVPVLRRKLWWMPLNLANPAWVDAEPDLSQHIVEIKLPKAARVGDGMAHLEAQVAALHPVLLDRKRPLWKFHVFEGLAPSAHGHKRVAMYKPAAPCGRRRPGRGGVGRRDPRRHARATRDRAATLEAHQDVSASAWASSLRGALANQIQQVSHIIKELPGTVGTLGGATGTALQSALANSKLFGGKGGAGNIALAPKTAFNASVTSGRAFAAVSLPLGEIKAIGKAHEATINDMVLMLVSTALRRYLGKKRACPRRA